METSPPARIQQTFDHRVVVVTGVGKRGQVGPAIGAWFAQRGARLFLIGRSQSEVHERARDISVRTNAEINSFACDLANPAEVGEVARQISEETGGTIHTLVHAAGGFAMSGSVADSDIEVLDHQLTINLRTAFATTRAFLPALRKGRGSIVYFGAAAALPGASGAKLSAYVAAKSGLLAFMKIVADEERDNGVRSNAIAPTSMRTDRNIAEMGADKDYVELDVVAETVGFLASDAGRATTGQVIKLQRVGR